MDIDEALQASGVHVALTMLLVGQILSCSVVWEIQPFPTCEQVLTQSHSPFLEILSHQIDPEFGSLLQQSKL